MLHEFRPVSQLTDIARSMLDAIVVDGIRPPGRSGDATAAGQADPGGLL